MGCDGNALVPAGCAATCSGQRQREGGARAEAAFHRDVAAHQPRSRARDVDEVGVQSADETRKGIAYRTTFGVVHTCMI